MEETIFKGGWGEGVILEQGEKLEDFYEIDKSDVQLGDTTLVYNEETTLCDYFNRPVQYCGKDAKNKLYFLLGQSGGDLFTQPRIYYETMTWITPLRFFRMYTFSGGRDMNFKNGKWK